MLHNSPNFIFITVAEVDNEGEEGVCDISILRKGANVNNL